MPQLVPYLKLSIHNQTGHPRDVVVMSCGWDDSWVQRGAYGLCGGWGCDKNFAKTITIPVGQALVFCGALCGGTLASNGLPGFSLGFSDFTQADFASGALYSNNKKKRAKRVNSRTVYWSNELNGNADLATTPEITSCNLHPGYYLSEPEK